MSSDFYREQNSLFSIIFMEQKNCFLFEMRSEGFNPKIRRIRDKTLILDYDCRNPRSV